MYTLLVTGDVPGASTYWNPLLQQTIIPCTSGTRPTGVHNGMTVYETDTTAFRRYDGSAWRRTGAFGVEDQGHGGAVNTTAITGMTSTTATAGSPVVGFSFVAPPSGGVYATVGGRILQFNNGQEVLLGWELRTGGTVGSGTVVFSAASDRCITAGQAVNTSGPALLRACDRYRIGAGALTPGATYNVRTMHWVTGGSASIEHRSLLIEPVL